MEFFQPWQLLMITLAGWVNRHQQEVIEYLITENQVLKEKFGKKRIILNDDQRRRLAVKVKILGRKALAEISTIFTPDTILRWHRKLIAKKWDYSKRRKKVGRPPISKKVRKQVLRLAKENPTWGYDRIEGALKNLKMNVKSTKIALVLKEHGIEPAPDRKRKTTWKTFIKSHLYCLGAIDFTTIEVWTKSGLVPYYLLFVMRLGTREVEFAGYTTNPDGEYVKQIGRNLSNPIDGFLKEARYLLMDRDEKFTKAFRDLIEDGGTKVVRLPAMSPNLNAYLERFVRSVKGECLSRFIFFGINPVGKAILEYLAHYHRERNHQGLNNELIRPGKEVLRTKGAVCRRERLGGLLNYYYRRAA